MSRSTPHCPFDRLWQPGHPFRPRRSKGRRWTMACLLIFISAFISSYFYLTDPARIKSMSQSYLSGLVGGHVEIGGGSLTIFEGLKLSQVSVTTEDMHSPDSTLFYAENIEIQYNPASLLRGQLEATRIIATGAKVKLVEDPAKGKWNYQRLSHTQPKPAVTQPAPHPAPVVYPELDLRDAQVQYSELLDGQCQLRGNMAIEGRLFPSGDKSLYRFDLQSRGAIEGVGAVASGYVTLKNGTVNATLSHVRFGPDLEAMLPHEVRDFWAAHRFEGALDIPEFKYTPATRDHRATFRVQTFLKDVQLMVRSEEFTEPPVSSLSPSPLLVDHPSLARTALQARKLIAQLHPFPQRTPLNVNDVSGSFTFDEKGIRFDQLTASIAGATLLATGRIDGYSPDAPIWCRVESKPGQVITIPEKPEFLASLPGQLHQIYSMLKPHGSGTIWMELNRALPNGLPQVTGELSIVDGYCTSIFFPYPVQHATGKVIFGPDPTRSFELITLQDIHGHGVKNGPNEKADLRLSGWVSSDDTMGCRIRARAKGVRTEPELFAAFPPPVRKVMEIFKGPGDELRPHFAGDFDCNVVVPPGVHMRPIVSVDLNFTGGSGRLAAFPYPLENMHGQVLIRDGYLDIDDLKFQHNDATVNLAGHVSWPVNTPDGVDPIVTPDLKLIARNVPVDNDLLKPLPGEARNWLHTIGATGMIDVDGHIIPKAHFTTAADAIGFDLDVHLRDGAARPPKSDFAITDLAGRMMIHPDQMEVLEMHGKRGEAALAGGGSIDWSSGKALVKLTASASQLMLDPALRSMVPPPAQQAWATLDPHGKINADLVYQGLWAPAKTDAGGEPIASLSVPREVMIAGPAAAPVNIQVSAEVSSKVSAGEDFKLTLRPIDVTVTPKPLPYRLDHCSGTITVTPREVVIDQIKAGHGKASVQLSGRSMTANPNDWDLSLLASDLPADDDLRKALPLPMRQVLDELKYKGNLSVDLKTFRYRGEQSQPDVDLSGVLSATKGSVDVGMPMGGIDGSVHFDAAVRAGKLAAFRGDLNVAEMLMADRPMKNLKAAMNLPSNSDVLHIGQIRGQLAGGELAGQMDLKFPTAGPSSYSLDFQLKNANLPEMAKQVAPKGQEIKGQVSASVALQGEWADPSRRRGRGDVVIAGKQMYQIPLMLGLLEVTNLSLPTSNPFNEGTARYLVEGNRITFQQVQMRSDSMVMSGNGWLDFGSKQVRMNFTTENPNLPQLPVIHQIWEGAKQELLQIQVRGTVQAPKVQAGSLHTFTTTIDEVFSGSGKEK